MTIMNMVGGGTTGNDMVIGIPMPKKLSTGTTAPNFMVKVATTTTQVTVNGGYTTDYPPKYYNSPESSSGDMAYLQSVNDGKVTFVPILSQTSSYYTNQAKYGTIPGSAFREMVVSTNSVSVPANKISTVLRQGATGTARIYPVIYSYQSRDLFHPFNYSSKMVTEVPCTINANTITLDISTLNGKTAADICFPGIDISDTARYYANGYSGYNTNLYLALSQINLD